MPELPPADESPEDSERSENEVTEEGELPAGRDRGEIAREIDLNPLSLVGSWFHRIEGDEVLWDGVVVGEVQPGKYLLEIRRGLGERVGPQVVMPIEELGGFRFYDTEEKMTQAYVEFVVSQEVT